MADYSLSADGLVGCPSSFFIFSNNSSILKT
jgi:hypothetical protein